MQYYILHNDQQIGPMSKEELLNYNLTPESLIWYQDLTEWTQASNIPELMAMLQPAATGGQGEWYVIVNGQQSGPFTAQHIASMGLGPDTPVWKNGMADWSNMGQVAEFSSMFAQQPVQQVFRQPDQTFGQQQMYQQPYQQPMQQPRQQQQPYGGIPMKSSNMTLAIIVTVLGLCSCIGLILGIIAITKVNSANKYYAMGDNMRGASEDKSAKTMAYVGLGFDIFGILVNFIILASGGY